MSNTTYELHGSTAVIALDSPPVNSLGHDVRVGPFSAGADIREFGTPQGTAGLFEIC